MQCLAELSPGTGVNPELVGQLTVLPEPRLQSAGHLEFRYPAPKNFKKMVKEGRLRKRVKEGQRGSETGQGGVRRSKRARNHQKRVKEGEKR